MNGNIAIGGTSHSHPENFDDSDFEFVTSGPPQHQQLKGDAYIAEINPDNRIIWSSKLLYETNGPITFVYPNTVCDITEDGDGNLFILGQVVEDRPNNEDFIPFGTNAFEYKGSSECFIIKFSQNRTLLWSTFFGGNLSDWPNSILYDGLGNILVTGTTQSTQSNEFPVKAVGNTGNILVNDLSYNGGYSDIFIAKFASSGAQIWTRYYGSPGKDAQGYLSYLDLEHPGIYIGSGNGTAVENDGTIYLTGTVQNDLTPLVGSNTECEFFHNVINGFASVNESGYTPLGNDAIFTVISSSNVMTFSSYWGGSSANPNKNEDFGYAMSTGSVPSTGKHFTMIGGWTNSGVVIPKGKNTIPICRESDGPYLRTDLQGGASDAFISKIYLDKCTTVKAVETFKQIYPLQISPIPASHTLNLNLKIDLPFDYSDALMCKVFDGIGKEAQGWSLKQSNANLIELNIQGLPNGYYFVYLQQGNQIATGKFIKI